MELQQQEFKQQLRDFVSSNFYLADPASLDERTSLLEQGTFDITVDDSEMLPENLDSIERIAAFVRRKKALLAETS